MTHSLHHPLLGEVCGTQHENENVFQYLGIQYATLNHRFAEPEVKANYEPRINATTFGPSVVTTPKGCDIEFGLIQHSLKKRPVPPVSDVDGLNLNITVPSSYESESGLPVLLLIHGGGFLFGGNWAPHYDLARIVAFSASIGKPIIGVSINYRLGVTGFLDSKELREAGCEPNRGILDQRAACLWVQTNIAGFGGDPDRVTAIGQSAGASSYNFPSKILEPVADKFPEASVMHLLNFQQAGAPLFSRAICMSGNLMTAPSITAISAQESYRKVVECLSIDQTLSSEDQLSALCETPPDDILTKVPPSVLLGPVLDGEREPPSFKAMNSSPPTRNSVPLMIGSAAFDGAILGVLGIFSGREASSLGRQFAEVLERMVPSDRHPSLETLLGAYGISTSEESNKTQTELGILQFATDLKFFASARAVAASWPSESWLYYFQDPNPWEGPHKGRSAHCLDLAYLFLNYKEVMSESQLKVATEFASNVVSFAYGEAPLTEGRSTGKVAVYGRTGENEELVSVVEENIVGPNSGVRAAWEEIGLHLLSQAWDAYMSRQ